MTNENLSIDHSGRILFWNDMYCHRRFHGRPGARPIHFGDDCLQPVGGILCLAPGESVAAVQAGEKSCVHVSSTAFQVSLPYVVRTRSTEVLPFGMIVANFVAGGLWGLYGLILDDNFLKVPNFLGVCFSAFLLLLYVHFPARPPMPRSASGTAPLLPKKEALYLDP